MARIAGVDLPRDKKIQYALPYIFGIGPSNSVKILAETGISPDARVRDLRDAEVARLRQVIERDYKVEGDFGVPQITHARVRADARLRENLDRIAGTDAEDVRKCVLDFFVARQIHACDTSHASP